MKTHENFIFLYLPVSICTVIMKIIAFRNGKNIFHEQKSQNSKNGLAE